MWVLPLLSSAESSVLAACGDVASALERTDHHATIDVNGIAIELVDLMDTLEWCARRRVLDVADQDLSKEEWKRQFDQFASLELMAEQVEFPTVFAVISALNARIDPNDPPNCYQLESDIKHVRDMILRTSNAACS